MPYASTTNADDLLPLLPILTRILSRPSSFRLPRLGPRRTPIRRLSLLLPSRSTLQMPIPSRLTGTMPLKHKALRPQYLARTIRIFSARSSCASLTQELLGSSS